MAPYERHLVGSQGESLACTYLESKGFNIIERNYRKKCGEIDIVAHKGKTTYFVEVKTISCTNIDMASKNTDGYRPEENIHPRKLDRLARAIQIYLAERRFQQEALWQLDALIVFLDKKGRRARVRPIVNIVLNT